MEYTLMHAARCLPCELVEDVHHPLREGRGHPASMRILTAGRRPDARRRGGHTAGVVRILVGTLVSEGDGVAPDRPIRQLASSAPPQHSSRSHRERKRTDRTSLTIWRSTAARTLSRISSSRSACVPPTREPSYGGRNTPRGRRREPLSKRQAVSAGSSFLTCLGTWYVGRRAQRQKLRC